MFLSDLWIGDPIVISPLKVSGTLLIYISAITPPREWLAMKRLSLVALAFFNSERASSTYCENCKGSGVFRIKFDIAT